MKLLDENLIILNADVNTAEECIRLIGQLFQEYGYVNEGYSDAVAAREKEYPTGLPGEGIAIAIPHTNNKFVNKPCVGVVIPRQPVSFGVMGTKDDRVACEVVIPMVIKDSKMQITMLQEMMKIIQDGALLKKIREAKSKGEVLEYLHNLEDCITC
ncbi:PTS sugar transporter subunit IIA [Anaerocolumna xylanovorans]|uniref:PTS system IIA component, Gat family (TC 4.A.5) n=1 Tax=Anaerocolumna xylanovorans DSM 12503 TaxID=1121345 RepID=A0A1M7YDH3_9FIRM|nr:PTS sugar transporter subunit IIA [Anaerocolumna xylanovorans]SHO50626.1 PTS system IIA component, Gat family (TC 4.A.5) [Anaerocolumna xylanovorans DSM 12503]